MEADPTLADLAGPLKEVLLAAAATVAGASADIRERQLEDALLRAFESAGSAPWSSAVRQHSVAPKGWQGAWGRLTWLSTAEAKAAASREPARAAFVAGRRRGLKEGKRIGQGKGRELGSRRGTRMATENFSSSPGSMDPQTGAAGSETEIEESADGGAAPPDAGGSPCPPGEQLLTRMGTSYCGRPGAARPEDCPSGQVPVGVTGACAKP